MPIAAIAAIGAVGSIAGGAIASSGASKAASAQATAAEQAAQLQHQDAQSALDFQKQVFGVQQRNMAPWLTSGKGAVYNLANLMGVLPKSMNPGRGVPPGSTTTTDANGFTRAFPTSGITSVGGPNGPPVRSALAMTPAQRVAAANGQRFIGPAIPGIDSTGAPTDSPQGGTNFGGGLPPDTPGSELRSNSLLDGVSLFGGGPSAPFDSGMTDTAAGPPLSFDGQALPPATDPNDPNAFLNPDLGAPGSLLQDWTENFNAPTDVTEQNDPGFKFRVAQGQQALERSAAARGNLLTGGTGKALTRYGQDQGSLEYGNVYNRALTEFQQRYNIFNNNQNTKFNRLASLAGLGETSAANLNSSASNDAGNVSNILLNSGTQIGANINNAAAARASGYVGSANAIGGAVSGASNLASTLALIKMMNGQT